MPQVLSESAVGTSVASMKGGDRLNQSAEGREKGLTNQHAANPGSRTVEEEGRQAQPISMWLTLGARRGREWKTGSTNQHTVRGQEKTGSTNEHAANTGSKTRKGVEDRLHQSAHSEGTGEDRFNQSACG